MTDYFIGGWNDTSTFQAIGRGLRLRATTLTPPEQVASNPELEDCPEAELNEDEFTALTYYNEAMCYHEHKNWPDYVYNLLWACELGHQDARQEYYNLDALTDYTGILEMIQESLNKFPQHSYFITFLGYMYFNGKSVDKDNNKAEELYTQAIEYKNSNAMANLAYMYFLTKKYVPATVLLNDAIKLGNHDAMWLLGKMFVNGLGLPRDVSKAKKYYKKAIKYGSYKAKNCLGYMYLEGIGVAQKYDKAKILFESAARHNSYMAMNNLAYMYQWGHGVIRDHEKAREMYEIAAEYERMAIFNLDLCI